MYTDPCTIALQTDKQLLEIMNEEFNEIAILDVADVFLQSEPTWEDDIPTPSDDYIMDNDFDDNF
tara:strand:- start:1663 stop:1857 length:195 start_codon:yes stop_codon:yes gene_type:complete